jgi:hypothetical protein
MSSEAFNQHWDVLIQLEQKSQEAYDTAILTLSGGALGVTFTFITDLLGDKPPIDIYLLTSAWIAWAGSICAILSSHLFSCFAIRKARYEFGQGKQAELGGAITTTTSILNVIAGVSFVIGVVFMTFFAVNNLSAKYPMIKENLAKPAIVTEKQPQPRTSGTASKNRKD